jgi:hypothetical protein
LELSHDIPGKILNESDLREEILRFQDSICEGIEFCVNFVIRNSIELQKLVLKEEIS